VRCGSGFWGRPASESGRLRHGDGDSEGGNRCRRGLVLTILLAWTAVLAPASANRFSCPSLRASLRANRFSDSSWWHAFALGRSGSRRCGDAVTRVPELPGGP